METQMSEMSNIERLSNELTDEDIGNMIVKKMSPEIAKERYDKWEYSYNEFYENYIKQSIENKEFTEGQQFTKKERDGMLNIGQYPFVINRIAKYIRTLVGLFVSGAPTFVSKPFGSEDNVVSDITNKIFKYVSKNSRGLSQIRRAFRSGLGTNIGWCMVTVDDYGRVVYKYHPMQYYCVDPDSTDPYYRDARWIYIHRYLHKSDITKMYGLKPEEIQVDAPVDLSQLYDAAGQKVPTVLKSDDIDYVRVIEGMHQIVTRKFDKLPNGDLYFTGNIDRKFIKETLLGYKHVYIEQVPDNIKHHKDIPVYFEDSDTPYKRGLTHYFKETQKLLNKCFAIMTFSAQLTANPIVFVYTDTLHDEDKKTFEEKLVTPGAAIYLKAVDGQRVAPVFKQPGQTNTAWFDMVQMLFRMFDFEGFNSQYFDMDSKAQNRTSALIGSHESMMNSIREQINIFDGFLESLAVSVLEYFFEYTPLREIHRAVGIDAHKKELEKYLKDYQLDPDDPKTIAEFSQRYADTMAPERIEDIIARAKEHSEYIKTLDRMIKDRNFIDYDISVESGSYFPSHSVYQFLIKWELYQNRLIDDESLLEDVPLANKDRIKSRMSTIQKLMTQVENVTEQNEDLLSENKQLKDSLYETEVKVKMAEHEGKLGKDYTDKRAKGSRDLKVANVRHIGNLRSIEKDIQYQGQLKLAELDRLAKIYQDGINEFQGKDKVIRLNELIGG